MLSPSHASTNKNGTSLLSAPYASCCYYYYYYMLVSSAFASPACLHPHEPGEPRKRRIYLTIKCKLRRFTYYLLPAALHACLPYSCNISPSSPVLCCVVFLSLPHMRADDCLISRLSAEFPRRAGRFGFVGPLRYQKLSYFIFLHAAYEIQESVSCMPGDFLYGIFCCEMRWMV